MRYRVLGKTNLRVSVIGVGTWQFGGEWGVDFSQSQVDAILDAAADCGINLIDTAECYGAGTSEAFIGGFLKTQKRSDWVIATKFGHQFHDLFNRTDHWTAAEVLKQLDESLARLGTDYIDVYQFHSGGDNVFDNADLWTALAKAKAAGKIRHLGISIGSNDNLHQTSSASKIDAETIQVVYNRLDRKPEERVLPSCLEQNLGVLARVPLASGFLSGKYKPGDEGSFPKNDVRGHWWTPEGIASTLKTVEEIKSKEVPAGVNMASWALAWVLQHPAVTCVIPGMKSVGQVDSNAAAADVSLSPAPHPQAA
jgi:aryl-alcohol dehydrogenase-like predicted oxidoreductase